MNKQGNTIRQESISYTPNGFVKFWFDYNLLTRKDSVIIDEQGKITEEFIYTFHQHTNRKHSYYKSGHLKEINITEIMIIDGESISQNHLRSKLVYEYE